MGASLVGHLVSALVAVAAALLGAAPAASAARAFFVFGDSLVDNGNNNYLMTTARADAPPYGIDFPTRMPTGRFSNGFNIPDIISYALTPLAGLALPQSFQTAHNLSSTYTNAMHRESEYLGSQPALPYLSPELRGENLRIGANFASAGVGILNDTGIQFVNIIRIGQQLQNFQDYQQKLAAFIGDDAARGLVKQALVLITLGGNDFVNNYYLVPYSVRSQQFAIQDYVPYLISEYKKILTDLNLGQTVLHGTLYKAALISTVKTSWRQSMRRYYFYNFVLTKTNFAITNNKVAKSAKHSESRCVITFTGVPMRWLRCIYSRHMGERVALVQLLYMFRFCDSAVGYEGRGTGSQLYRFPVLKAKTACMQRLYELGARRVIVTGTGLLGCVPAELALHSLDGSCAPDLTQATDLFNPQLVRMLNELNGELGHDAFIAANTNKISFDFVFNPRDYGFVTAKVACCGQGPYNGIGLCTPASNVCANRDVYAYWDAFHPTERANRIIVAQFMHGSTDHISPMNISTILAMDKRG
uniref:PH01B035L11.15 protein n=1 Tax=Phyllostachys edulis TaxID=38705 RepID=L0P240_PHYED|nr:PH01B035L11.15 [Phyllostachys edulis]